MLAKKNKDIKKAYNLLRIISKNDKARMAYEVREAEIHDQMTRIKTARRETKEEVAVNLLKLGVDGEIVAKGTGLSIERIIEIKNNISS